MDYVSVYPFVIKNCYVSNCPGKIFVCRINSRRIRLGICEEHWDFLLAWCF